MKDTIRSFSKLIPTRKLTCPLKRDYFSREYKFDALIFRGHVNFQGSISKDVLFPSAPKFRLQLVMPSHKEFGGLSSSKQPLPIMKIIELLGVHQNIYHNVNPRIH